MDNLLAGVVSVLAGIGSLVCFILVMVHLFQTNQSGFAITCIVLVFVCGIGGLIAYVKGWMEGLGPVMWAWTGCIVLGLLTNFVVAAGG